MCCSKTETVVEGIFGNLHESIIPLEVLHHAHFAAFCCCPCLHTRRSFEVQYIVCCGLILLVVPQGNSPMCIVLRQLNLSSYGKFSTMLF